VHICFRPKAPTIARLQKTPAHPWRSLAPPAGEQGGRFVLKRLLHQPQIPHSSECESRETAPCHVFPYVACHGLCYDRLLCVRENLCEKSFPNPKIETKQECKPCGSGMLRARSGAKLGLQTLSLLCNRPRDCRKTHPNTFQDSLTACNCTPTAMITK